MTTEREIVEAELIGLLEAETEYLSTHKFYEMYPDDGEFARDKYIKQMAFFRHGEHFLQRYRRRLPAPGLLGVFNRSHYEALISDPLDGLCADADFPRRLVEVQGFEAQWPPRHLHALKCYLYISRAEQKERLLSRLQRPEKRWKLHASDLQAYREHDLRQARWSALLAASHTEDAPWYVIPSDQRWLRDWLVASLLARELERLDLDWPDTPAPFCAADLEQP